MSDKLLKVTVRFSKENEELKNRILGYQEKIGEDNKTRLLMGLIEKGLESVEGGRDLISYEFEKMSEQIEELRQALGGVVKGVSGLTDGQSRLSEGIATLGNASRGLKEKTADLCGDVEKVVRCEVEKQLGQSRKWTEELVEECRSEVVSRWRESQEKEMSKRQSEAARLEESLGQKWSDVEARLRESVVGRLEDVVRESVKGLENTLRKGLAESVSDKAHSRDNVLASVIETDLSGQLGEFRERIESLLKQWRGEFEEALAKMAEKTAISQLERLARVEASLGGVSSEVRKTIRSEIQGQLRRLDETHGQGSEQRRHLDNQIAGGNSDGGRATGEGRNVQGGAKSHLEKKSAKPGPRDLPRIEPCDSLAQESESVESARRAMVTDPIVFMTPRATAETYERDNGATTVSEDTDTAPEDCSSWNCVAALCYKTVDDDFRKYFRDRRLTLKEFL